MYLSGQSLKFCEKELYQELEIEDALTGSPPLWWTETRQNYGREKLSD
jgi:predicted nicotinamide N-methyase